MLDDIDWASLRHHRGFATDTRDHLAALTSGDKAAQEEALAHLDDAVLHQRDPSEATVPAARVIIRLLADRAIADPETRGELVMYLGWIAEATAFRARTKYIPDDIAALEQRALGQLARESYPVVAGCLDDDVREVREQAALSAVWHVDLPVLADRRPALAARLRARADLPGERRAFWVRQLSALDEDTRTYLSDPDPLVRTSAALAPSLATDSEVTDLIVAELSRVTEFDGRGLDPEIYSLPQLLEAALARVDSLERILGSARTIIRNDDWTGFDLTWGPLLRAAFSPPYSPGVELSSTQRTILRAVVANRRIWRYDIGNSALAFRAAGLPFRREDCARIAGWGRFSPSRWLGGLAGWSRG